MPGTDPRVASERSVYPWFSGSYGPQVVMVLKQLWSSRCGRAGHVGSAQALGVRRRHAPEVFVKAKEGRRSAAGHGGCRRCHNRRTPYYYDVMIIYLFIYLFVILLLSSPTATPVDLITAAHVIGLGSDN